MIDLHTHILPGFDDGANNFDDSIEMARQAVDDGINTIIASPHIYDNISGPTKKQIIARTDELNKLLEEKAIPCRVLPGSEVHISADLCDSLDAGEILTVANGGRYLLLELPLREVPKFTEEVIYNLNLAGVCTIIAHPERNEAIIKKPLLLENLIHLGALTQVSSGSLLGSFGCCVRQAAALLLENNLLHLIASDGHSPRHRRIQMAKSRQLVAERIGGDYARMMTEDFPRKILKGENIQIPEAKKINWYKQFYHQIALALPR